MGAYISCIWLCLYLYQHLDLSERILFHRFDPSVCKKGILFQCLNLSVYDIPYSSTWTSQCKTYLILALGPLSVKHTLFKH